MRKLVSVLLTLAVVLGLSLTMAVPVAAATINVPGDEPTIQAAIDNATVGDTIVVAAGTYEPFTVDTKTDLTIQSDGVVIVEGAQSVATAYGNRDCVVFVKDSTNTILDGLDIQGLNLGTTNPKNYGVIYENSNGEIRNCTVSPNTIGNMLSIAIGIWDNSDVTIDTCTIKNYGRVGILVYKGCTVEILDSTIEGQVYSGETDVCYGIEVEGEMGSDNPATASQVTITGNEIYNCDNDGVPLWESAAILINGWLELDGVLEADCTVIMENNDIHDNYIGIYAVKSPSSYAHFNNIYDNRVYGVISAAASDLTTAVFDAENNWWGDASGPSGVGSGSGDAVSDNVDYIPWLTGEWTGSSVGLTADVPDIVAISVDPTSIDYGALLPGQISSEEGVTVTNIGTRIVNVNAQIAGDALFYHNLQLVLSGSWTPGPSWTNVIAGLAMGNSEAARTRLVVPSDYIPSGTETGLLIFIARKA